MASMTACAAAAVAKAKNDKGAAQAVMDAIAMDKEKYRLGHTKVFFRAGQLGTMEEVREAKIDKAVQECNKVTGEHDVLMAQKNEYTLALQSGGSAVQDIVDKTNRIEAMKNDLQKQVDELNARIKGEEE